MSAATAKHLAQQYWQYSLRHYASPAIADLCLSLQDNYGINVNLLLFAGFLSQCRYTLPAAKQPLLMTRVRTFDQRYLRRIRRLRRRVKTLLPDQSPRWYADFKQLELTAERLQQVLIVGVSYRHLVHSKSTTAQNLRLLLTTDHDVLDAKMAKQLDALAQLLDLS
ncbi:MAG: TIGR02444 family protein [Pseudomonadales bacterium]